MLTLSGYFDVYLTAHGAIGDASGYLFVSVKALPSSTTPLAAIPLEHSRNILADPLRERLYVSLSGKIAVLDSKTFAVISTVPVDGNPTALSISRDGKRLWVTGYFSTSLQAINLDTLTALPTLPPA